MKLFLASNIGGIKKENGKRIPVKFFENNNFFDYIFIIFHTRFSLHDLIVCACACKG